MRTSPRASRRVRVITGPLPKAHSIEGTAPAMPLDELEGAIASSRANRISFAIIAQRPLMIWRLTWPREGSPEARPGIADVGGKRRALRAQARILSPLWIMVYSHYGQYPTVTNGDRGLPHDVLDRG